MAESPVPGALRRLRIPFYTPVPQILAKIATAFAVGAHIVEVRGFPMPVYCVREPEDNVAILRDRAIGETKVPALLPRVKRLMRSGAYISPGGPQWRERRRQIQPAFKAEQLKQYVAEAPGLTQRRSDGWGRASARIDIAHEFRLLITALNLKMFFSVDVDGERLSDIADWTHFIESRLVGILPLWVPTPTNRRFIRNMKALRREFRTMIEARAVDPGARRDLLAVLHAATHGESAAAWSVDEMIDESFSVYFGASVMAVSLTWGFYLLAKHPELQNELYQEAQKCAGDTESILSSTVFDHFVNEVLRLYPASWGYPRHCKNGMQLAGVRIPAGAIVIPMIEQAHHHAALWDDAEAFCPARFTSESAQQAVSRHTLLPFGMGARTCLGANLAPMVIKVIACELLQTFEFSLPLDGPQRFDIEYGFEIQPQGTVRLDLQRRQ